MSGKRLIVVGQLGGAFGVKGEARVRSFTEDPEACFAYGPLLNAAGEVVMTPVKVRPITDGFGVITKEKLQREEWEKLKGTMLHVPREVLPAPEDDNELYVTDLIGLVVVHVDGRAMGVIRAAHDFGAGDLIEVQPESGASFLIPFTHEAVPEIDIELKIVRIEPDEELLPEALQRQRSDGGTN